MIDKSLIIDYNKDIDKRYNTKREVIIMTGMAIKREWYEEIKGLVATENAYFYNDSVFGEMVEVDVDEEQFNKVSRELGWMY